MFGHMLPKLPPGVRKNRAVSKGAAVTCIDSAIRSTNKRGDGGGKVTLPILRSFEDPHSIDAIYPETVSLREKVTCKYSHSPVLIKDLRGQKPEDPC